MVEYVKNNPFWFSYQEISLPSVTNYGVVAPYGHILLTSKCLETGRSWLIYESE